MTNIGVICRGKYGTRLVETILSKTNFEVVSTSVPEHLPNFIDEPEEYLDTLNLNADVFFADVVITYSLHPDLTPKIIEKAGKAGVKVLIVPGGASKTPIVELYQIAEKYNMHIEIEEICCNLNGNEYTAPFTDRLSQPLVEIKTENGIISDVKVIKGALCGSTWFMAEELKGTIIKDAPAKAGLLIQQYPCRAVRGTMTGIHKAAQIHKNAVTCALKKTKT